jgi:hypothetical protein
MVGRGSSAGRAVASAPARGAPALATLLAVDAEEVEFAGQPPSADAGSIATYYGSHRAAVMLGNVLWLTAALLLLVAVRRATLGATGWGSSPWRLSLVAAAAMGLTSVTALLLTATAPDPPGGVVGWWRTEGALFGLGVWLWLAVLVVLGVLGVASVTRERAGSSWPAYVGLTVAALAVVDPAGTRWWLVLGGLTLLTAVTAPLPATGSYPRVASRHRTATRSP